MPKLKSKSGASKRLKVTGTGKVMGTKAGRRHILTNKNRKSKRHMREDLMVSKSQQKKMRIALLA